MDDKSTVDLGRQGDDTRAWNSREEEAKHYARTFVGDVLGGYRIVKEIGHGSMGVVFLGEHVEDKRHAAVKILPPSLSVTTTVIKRFLREAESVKKLDHESIVRVFSVGVENGIHFYAMQFIEGASLDRVLRQRRFSVRECATIVAEASRALFYAHEQQIIHRDIKPGNIILTLKDRPVITDFGLAKPEKAATLTESGALVGTPIYMSPEQVRADKTLIDRRTDIYSLGITLYEMLAGVTPYEGASTQEILQKIENVDPAQVRKVRPDVPKALETICHKAIEKAPARRYQTAIELALDLERFLRGEPIQARPASTTGRLFRKAKKHPAICGLSLLVVIAVGFGVVQAFRSKGQQELTKQAELKTNAAQYLEKLALASATYAVEGPSAAIIVYSEAIGLDRNGVDAYVERGKCYYLMQSYEKALADFDSALRIDGQSHRARLWRANVLFEGTNPEREEAIREFTATLTASVEDPELNYLAARFCLDLARDATSAIARDSLLNSVDRRLQTFLRRVREIDEEARRSGKKANLKYREDEGIVLQGMLYEEEGFMEEAFANYRRALELNMSNAMARRLLQADRVKAVAAEADTSPTRRVGASTWMTVLTVEGLSWASRRIEAEPDFLRRAADAMNIFKPEDDAARTSDLPDDVTLDRIDQELLTAEAKWMRGDEAGAVAIYEKVLVEMPGLVEPWCRLAEHYLSRPDGIEKAVSHAEAALRLNATNPYALSVAVQVYSKKGDRKRVVELARQIESYHAVLLTRPDVRAALAPYVDDLESRKPAADGSPSGGD